MDSSDRQTIFRIEWEDRDRFTPLHNAAIEDSRMSFRATGLLVYLLSRPKDWVTRQSQLSNAKREGRDAVVSAFNELRSLGYIHKQVIRERGRIANIVWRVFERPRATADDLLTEKPETVRPETVQPVSENPQLQKKDKNKRLKQPKNTDTPSGAACVFIDIDGNAANPDVVMVEWNKLPKPFAKILKLTSGRREKINTRLRNDDWLNGWREAIRLIPNIGFLRGEGRGGWVADFDWFIRNNENLLKIVEGKFGTGSSMKTVPLRENEVPNVANVEEELRKMGVN